MFNGLLQLCRHPNIFMVRRTERAVAGPRAWEEITRGCYTDWSIAASGRLVKIRTTCRIKWIVCHPVSWSISSLATPTLLTIFAGHLVWYLHHPMCHLVHNIRGHPVVSRLRALAPCLQLPVCAYIQPRLPAARCWCWVPPKCALTSAQAPALPSTIHLISSSPAPALSPLNAQYCQINLLADAVPRRIIYEIFLLY